MNEALKPALNNLQLHLERETKTDNVLLIFDNVLVKNEYIKLFVMLLNITLKVLSNHFN